MVIPPLSSTAKFRLRYILFTALLYSRGFSSTCCFEQSCFALNQPQIPKKAENFSTWSRLAGVGSEADLCLPRVRLRALTNSRHDRYFIFARHITL